MSGASAIGGQDNGLLVGFRQWGRQTHTAALSGTTEPPPDCRKHRISTICNHQYRDDRCCWPAWPCSIPIYPLYASRTFPLLDVARVHPLCVCARGTPVLCTVPQGSPHGVPRFVWQLNKATCHLSLAILHPEEQHSDHTNQDASLPWVLGAHWIEGRKPGFCCRLNTAGAICG